MYLSSFGTSRPGGRAAIFGEQFVGDAYPFLGVRPRLGRDFSSGGR